MAKTSKSSKASTTKTSSSSALKTSSKAKGSKPATQSRSNLKGLKVRDRKDVENMNDLKNIGELHSRLSTTSSKKQAVKVRVLPPERTFNGASFADALLGIFLPIVHVPRYLCDCVEAARQHCATTAERYRARR